MLCFFLASTLMAMITVGGLNSFSILYKELLDFYDTRAGDTAIDQVVELLLKAFTHPSQKPMVGRFCLILKELKSFDVPVYLAL